MNNDTIDWSRYAAVLFDLDGVVTSTARIHASAWKAVFDEFLGEVAPDQDRFDADTEYRAAVDGKPRYEGVSSFLERRGITLPWGEPDDPPGFDTVCALGNAKNRAFGELLHQDGAEVYPDALALLSHLAAAGIPMAVVSSSANCETVLESAGLSGHFGVRVDGLVSRQLDLAGKPEPDTFVEAARRLGAEPAAAVVIEDAVSGIEAAVAGGFGLVIGVARHGDEASLRDAGADLVVPDLSGLVPEGGRWAGYPFEPEPWALTRDGITTDLVGVDETLFALANGNLGVRASFAQGSPVHEPGALLNGFHESWPIVYPEPGYGFARHGQTILYLPDASLLAVEWDGTRLSLADAEVSRRLDFRTGVETTTAEWPQARVLWERLVSLRHDDVLAQRVTIEAKDRGELGLRAAIVNRVDQDLNGRDVKLFPPGSEIDPRLAPEFGRRVLEPTEGSAEGNTCVLGYRTAASDLPLTVASRIEPFTAAEWEVTDADRADLHATLAVEPGTTHRATSVVSYRRDADLDAARRYLEELGGFDALAVAQQEELDAFWDRADIEIEGDPIAQQAVRFAILQLHWATASLGGRGVPARGLSGRTYEGHHFWDSDVFVMSFVTATDPGAAREMIRYRHHMLPQARRRATDLSVEGALFPWRTITGDEASAYFEASTAQFHIDADVVHGLRRYLEWTGDDETLWDMGVEIAVETARMWASLGFHDEDGVHFHGVTGPDEYTALVNDNAYTNQMARMNLRFAAASVERMRSEEPARFERLATRLDLDPSEAERWADIADEIVVLHDDELGVTAQDSSFLSLEPWDWDTPRDKYPLLRHFHPLVIYRHRVLKQADTVMAHFLLPGDAPLAQRRADFDYYDPITTGDSSLSPAIQSAVAAEVGRPGLAWDHFTTAATLDLIDRTRSASNGIHLACAAGVWLAVVHGFAGIDLVDGAVITDPRLPEGWDSVTISLQVHGERVRVRVDRPTGGD